MVRTRADASCFNTSRSTGFAPALLRRARKAYSKGLLLNKLITNDANAPLDDLINEGLFKGLSFIPRYVLTKQN